MLIWTKNGFAVHETFLRFAHQHTDILHSVSLAGVADVGVEAEEVEEDSVADVTSSPSPIIVIVSQPERFRLVGSGCSWLNSSPLKSSKSEIDWEGTEVARSDR